MKSKFDLFYRRPAFVPYRSGLSKDDLSIDSDDNSSSRSSFSSTGIPPELSFDRILAGDSRSPCGLQDFLKYCLFVEHSAENLQFYLWLQDYTRRFHEAPSFDRDLSPEWTTDDQTRALRRARADARKASRVTPISSSLAQLAAIDRFSSDVKPLESSATSVVEPDNLNPFGTPPDTPSMPPNTVHASISLSDIPANGPRSTTASFRTGVSKDESLYTGFSASSATSESFTNVGLAKPFTIQPFRDEIEQVISIYFADGAPRELNLASTEKRAILMALQKTTHPSAFDYPRGAVKRTLIMQSHPNFIRWVICNCNMPRRIFCFCLGIALLLCGILTSLLFTLSGLARGFRAIGAIFVILGASFLFFVSKGMCPIIYGLHNRHLRPWEGFFLQSGRDIMVDALAPFGSRVDDDADDVPWAAWYEKRNLLRKIFDRKIWIQEPAVRWIQDQIALQAFALSLPAAAVFLVVFLTVPDGNMF